MSSVTNFIQTVDCRVWHGIEKLALKYPSGSRALAIPVALGIFVRDLLAPPAKCLEEFILTGKSIKVYALEKNQRTFSKSNNLQMHLLRTVKYGLMTPFSPLSGLIDAIVSLVKILVSPIKTAKINIAKRNFFAFVEKLKYTPKKIYSNNELITFACEYEFAKSIFNRFDKAVKSAKDVEQISQIYFMKEQNAVAEIELKSKKLEETYDTFIDKYAELLKRNREQNFNETSRNSSVKRFNKEWREFQQQLIDSSDPNEINNLSFFPTFDT